MASTDVPMFEGNLDSPRPFAVAAWFGMSEAAIMAGLKDGSILPPPGSPPDWVPPENDAALVSPSSSPDATDNAPAIETPGIDPGFYIGMARVQGWMQALDPMLPDVTFQSIWKGAGIDDTSRAANLTAYLAKALLGETIGNVARADSAPAQSLSAISAAITAFTADPAHHAHLVDLAGMDGAELAKLAQTDIGYRYALSQLDSVALIGNRTLFASADAQSGLDRFDPDTGEVQLSDAWLADRGKFLAWKMAAENGGDLSIDGAEGWTFIDRSLTGADGQPLTLKLSGQDETATVNQVIFGASTSESIKGNAGTDRIYGGDGDDVLRGAGGADHLEGGHGDDLAFGGSGNDELVGNQGNDDLDGGRGADSLDGGSGDDTLTGGRGDDLLVGGSGTDAYVIDGGDGTDTIIDSDGLGAISLDDETITGGATTGSGKWTSSDGRLEFSLDGALSSESTLTIRSFEDGADHESAPDDVIHVSHWHNGDLGITLIADGSPDQPVGTDDPGNPDTGPDPVENDPPPGPDVVAPTAGDLDTGPAPPIDAWTLDPPQSDLAPDLNDALVNLLAPPSLSVAPIDSRQVQNALDAFGAVPLPPDIASPGHFAGNPGNNAISIADVTGALSDDIGSDDFGHEAAGLVPVPPEWHRPPNEIVTPMDGDARGVGNGIGASRR